jgi:hypothetical protein
VNEKIIIGRRDRADFPEWNLEDIDIKIDTGAYTSSIHCHHIEQTEQNGKPLLRFELLDPSHPSYHNKTLTTTEFKQKLVKNSFGVSEKRYVVRSLITLFEKQWPIELTLSLRGEMKFPVLIGRKLLNKSFVVDTQKSNLSFRRKTKALQGKNKN